ncbi:MAG: hypothetical protein ACR2JJ_07125, partial [Sphingomicrobium sp.]
AIAARASSAPTRVPMAADHSTTMLIVQSHKPISVAVGSEKKARRDIKLEKANGQMSRGLARLATAALTKAINDTKTLNGRIRMVEKSTLKRY